MESGSCLSNRYSKIFHWRIWKDHKTISHNFILPQLSLQPHYALMTYMQLKKGEKKPNDVPAALVAGDLGH